MDKLKIFTKSFLSLFAVMRLTGMTTKNPVSVIFFLTFIFVYSKFESDEFESRIMSCDIVLSSVLGVLFAFFTVCAKYVTILGSLTSRLFCIIILMFSAIGLFVIFFHLCIWLSLICDKLTLVNSVYPTSLLPYAAFAVCIVCWMPYFLFEYPAVMTPDSVNQFSQAMGVYELNNQHSIVHTAIIGLCYRAGFSIFENMYAGIATYTVIQMIFMAFTAGFVVRTLQKAGIITPVIIVVVCFYGIMPYNGAYAVTMWKDIPFAGFMTLLAASLMRLAVRNGGERLAPSEYLSIVVPYTVSAVMVCVLRTNGWYAFVASVPFILIIYRKDLKFMLPVHAIVLVVVLFVKYPIMEIYDVRQADFAESVSIPVQQIARVIANGEELDETEAEFVGKIMDIEQVASVYQADVSDNIKNLIRQNGIGYLENNKDEFFSIWFSIGLKHPKAYFDAYVDQTIGYWFPDVACEVGLADGIYDNPFKLSWQPVINGSLLVKLKEIIFKLPELIPLYGLLWSMGFMFWVILLAGALCLKAKSAKNAVVVLPFILLIATLCIATPVANEFRYAYPVFYALPVLLMSPFVHNNG